MRYKRNLLKHLRQRELAAAGKKLSKEIGLAFAPTRDGARFEGVYRKPGRVVGGVMRGATASFEFGKKRGMRIG